jgi:hypothetical protein
MISTDNNRSNAARAVSEKGWPGTRVRVELLLVEGATRAPADEAMEVGSWMQEEIVSPTTRTASEKGWLRGLLLVEGATRAPAIVRMRG